MIKQIFILNEQIKQIQIHKWIESEKNHRDMAEDAVNDWVIKYAKGFRSWSNTLSDLCINCPQKCQKDSSECLNPFNELRIQKLANM